MITLPVQREGDLHDSQGKSRGGEPSQSKRRMTMTMAMMLVIKLVVVCNLSDRTVAQDTTRRAAACHAVTRAVVGGKAICATT